MNITINNTEYQLKYTVRALFIFEKISNKMFEGKTLTELYLLFYSILLANNNIDFTFDDLINYCDEDLTLFTQFNAWLMDEFKVQNQFTEEKEDVKKKKKGKK
jgi:hypothetical protein